MAKSPEARKIRRDLDKELESVAHERGHTLVWSAQEQAVIGLICDQIDRKVEIFAAYEESSDPKVKVKLSGEMRLLEQSVARLLRQVKTDVPGPESQRTVAARRAVRARWDRGSA
ncbi:hypothetical protein MGALJ_10080 [Mycobacterium gallinarum]|uniref:Uncharacterized protein n=1 Tax=Mycobacterium gallinarum TaxID=39689 RepID=A0A9W4AZF4_9MYCO|nr:hypothetical protein [Mycobacterium gallinarum]BBY91339.1 hypothetical protein MGALJ_10080 [Mycobacterium gallinarum]